MKRTITFVFLIVIIFIGYYLVANGFKIGNNLNISSYELIKKQSTALTKKLASYDKKNKEEYQNAKDNLDSSIQLFNSSKLKYEKILEEMSNMLEVEDGTGEEAVEEIIYSDKEKYKVDFLLVTLGEYGLQEGVDVVYQLTTSSTTDPNASTLNYFLANLNFTVTGQYIDVATFISDLENDDRLSWEIKNFKMIRGKANGYDGVSATFTIKDVPIDSESYLESTNIVEIESTADDNNKNVVNNTSTQKSTDNSTNTIANTVN